MNYEHTATQMPFKDMRNKSHTHKIYEASIYLSVVSRRSQWLSMAQGISLLPGVEGVNGD